MEGLTRLGEPIVERLRAVTSTGRMVGIGLGLLIALGLWLLVGRSAPRDYVGLLDGREFSEPQIARLSAAFRKHRLEDARITGRIVEIPAAQQDVYLMAVDAENAWPAKFDAPIERALAEANPLMPWQQNRESLQRGEKQMLARIVSEMSGIENAAVQYDEIRHPGFPPRVESRAMVAVKAVGLRHLEIDEVEAIRDTVVAFKSGLQRENVTITDLNACRAYPGNRSSIDSCASTRTLAATRRAVEDQWRTKIEQRLHMYPDVTVSVSAHFVEVSEDLPRNQHPDAETPAPIQPVQVSASIDVPRSYFYRVWHQRYGTGTPPPEQIHQIEQEVSDTISRAVHAMLPPSKAPWASAHQVAVTSHDPMVTDPVQLADSPSPRSGLWLIVIGAALGMGAIFGCIVVLIHRATIRRAHPAAGDHRSIDNDSSPLGTVPNDHDPRSPVTLPDLQQQVNRLVQEDPVIAAHVLKQWMNRAA
jgi:hypothetical protein